VAGAAAADGAAGAGAGAGAGRGASITGGAAFLTGAGAGEAEALSSLGFTGDGRDCRPRRCALPITALRLTSPSASAIWLAVMPFSHIVLSVSMRSSVQLIHIPSKTSPDGCGASRQRLPAWPMDAPTTPGEKITVMASPGVPVIRSVNWGGLRTLYVKEVRRFFKVHLQTIWAPAATTLLFLVVFTVATGAKRPVTVGGVDIPFGDFIAPGLIISQGMMGPAFANASFSLLVGKIQGTIVDYLMPPLSTMELLAALVGGAMTRAFIVGFIVWAAMALYGIGVWPQHLWAVVWFGFLGAAFLSLLGVLTSIWADKFDHAAAVTNFVIVPLGLLSGTFYSVDRLAPAFRAFSHANPFFYIISGFRYGFLGTADSPVLIGSAVVFGLDVVLALTCYWLLNKGWKIKS
jgi:ABC-2 type transport system permease protein